MCSTSHSSPVLFTGTAVCGRDDVRGPGRPDGPRALPPGVRAEESVREPAEWSPAWTGARQTNRSV